MNGSEEYDLSVMNRNELNKLLSGIDTVRVGILGDFCLDAYWHADMLRSVLSRETPHYPMPVVKETYSPGAAGNVAQNVAALQPASLTLLGVIGDDWRGKLLVDLLAKAGADVKLTVSQSRMTNAYIKPMLHGYGDAVQEQARLDFENDQPLSSEEEADLISQLKKAASNLDVLLVCDQMKNGCITEKVRETVCDLGRNGLLVVVDSRENAGKFDHVIVKPNELEAAGAVGGELPICDMCLSLSKKNKTTSVVTAGKDGCYVSDGEKTCHIPAWPAEPPFDICGAGDTFMAAFSCVLAGIDECSANVDPKVAALVGNMASSVTIRKLGMTGTASREELLNLL